MNRLKSLLKQRWLISLLGVLALAALIWFAGPYIAIAGRTVGKPRCALAGHPVTGGVVGA